MHIFARLYLLYFTTFRHQTSPNLPRSDLPRSKLNLVHDTNCHYICQKVFTIFFNFTTLQSIINRLQQSETILKQSRKYLNDEFNCTFDLVTVTWKYNRLNLKEGLQSVLRIGSAHNKGGPPNINIVQISHFSNSFWIETLVYIHL